MIEISSSVTASVAPAALTYAYPFPPVPVWVNSKELVPFVIVELPTSAVMAATEPRLWAKYGLPVVAEAV